MAANIVLAGARGTGGVLIALRLITCRRCKFLSSPQEPRKRELWLENHSICHRGPLAPPTLIQTLTSRWSARQMRQALEPVLPPAIKRKLEGDGANLIFLTFTPGQVLRSHTTAHPITVQALKGSLTLTTEDGEILLDPGTVVRLRAMVVHEVAAPEDAAEENVLLLTMLTGERHSETPAEEGNSE